MIEKLSSIEILVNSERDSVSKQIVDKVNEMIDVLNKIKPNAYFPIAGVSDSEYLKDKYFSDPPDGNEKSHLSAEDNEGATGE